MTDNPNNYENQKLRGLKRKYEYVMKRGELGKSSTTFWINS